MIHPLLKNIIDNDRAYDPWGAAMNAAFAFCDVLYVEGESMLIPSGLGYHAAMGTTSDSLEGEAVDVLEAVFSGELDYEDIEYALFVLNAYLDLLNRAGKDY